MSDAVANGFANAGPEQLAITRRRATLSCAIGNFFELFDFTIYGYFTVAITRVHSIRPVRRYCVPSRPGWSSSC
jgi:hypothetical protein